MTLQETFNLALQQHQAGKLAEAELLYRQVLAQQPNHSDALHLLGLAYFQVGKPEPALDLIGRSIAAAPNVGDYHMNHGTVLASIGRMQEAIESFNRSLALKPNNAEVYANLGSALRTVGRLDEAVAACRKALALQPDHFSALTNLGTALQDQWTATSNSRALDEATSVFLHLVKLRPQAIEGHSGLGAALYAKGEMEQAAASFQIAAQLHPADPQQHYNLGLALIAKRRADQAVACFQRAVTLRPNFAAAHVGLGGALQLIGRPEEALVSFRQALALEPREINAWNNLGNIYKDMGQLREAIECYEKAANLAPDNAVVDSNRLYTFVFDHRQDAASTLAQARLWHQRHAEPLAKFILPHTNDRSPNRRLRVGYVSPNLWAQSQSPFIVPLLKCHNHEQFEIVCFADVAHPDSVTEKMRACADVWLSTVGLSDQAVAEMVKANKIDILVDLTMHMGHGRPLLFGAQPAPVQICWLAYPGTTGLSAIDYRFTDAYLDPPGTDEFYVETLIRLPETFACYDPNAIESDADPLTPPPMQKAGLITFGSLNNFCKVNPPLLERWGRVLQSVPRSRLVQLVPQGEARRWMVQTLGQMGIDSARLEFVARLPRPRYLEEFRRIDICLDTLPYNGHTTSLDALWRGVPVVTRVGLTAAGRAGWSVMSNLKLTELAAHDDEQFVKIAVDLAADPSRLADYRRTLRQRMLDSPLTNAGRFAINVEAAYREMWKRWTVSQ